MKARTTFILFLTAILTLAAGSAFGAYSGGSGTAGDPYKIATKADLLALAANTGDYGNCFILTADVNLQGQVFTTAIIASGADFNGTFDGNDHKITNFTINGGSNSYLGLFGNTNTFGSVKNLGLENYSVSGNYYVGGLVGMNYGNISNCYSTGAVSGSIDVGGLVGCNSNGSISNCYSMGSVSGSPSSSSVGGLVGGNSNGGISNCYSTGSVSGYEAVGGLVGDNYNGSISNCYSTGSVSCSTGSYVGGLVGYNNGSSISNCYSTGAVSGSNEVGGLVGGNSNSSISNCYSTGSVSGSYYVGGLVGYNGSACSSCFWDTGSSGQTVGVGDGSSSVGVSGKTTAEMKTLTTFTLAGWDFTTIWAICEGTNYPRLIWQIPAGDWVCPDGVNFVDFAYFAARWRTTGCNSSNNFCSGADMDSSGTVDMQDLAIFAANWLSGE
jgi:hypothetical protein